MRLQPPAATCSTWRAWGRGALQLSPLLPAACPALGSRQPLSGAAVAIACLHVSIVLKLALLAATASSTPAPRRALPADAADAACAHARDSLPSLPCSATAAAHKLDSAASPTLLATMDQQQPPRAAPRAARCRCCRCPRRHYSVPRAWHASACSWASRPLLTASAARSLSANSAIKGLRRCGRVDKAARSCCSAQRAMHARRGLAGCFAVPQRQSAPHATRPGHTDVSRKTAHLTLGKNCSATRAALAAQ